MNTYTARAQRDGRFWYIEIPELDGATQARNLGEIQEMAIDYIATVLEVPETEIAVKVEIELPEAARVHLKAAETARSNEVAARAEAATQWRATVASLRTAGLTYREISTALNISHQRVAQLVKPQPTR